MSCQKQRKEHVPVHSLGQHYLIPKPVKIFYKKIKPQPFCGKFTKLGPFHPERASNLFSDYFWVWICLSSLKNLSQHNCLGVTDARFIGLEIPTTFQPSRDPIHSERGTGMNSCHIIQKQEPHRTLEWPPEGTTEAPIRRQQSAKMGSEFIH